MAEYIEREDTINSKPEGRNPEQPGKEEYNKGWNDCRRHFVRIIESQTAADVAPAIHAHWVYNPNGTDWNLGAWECSVCKCNNHNLPANENYNPYSFVGSRYCPNCGAKMDEVTKNG